MHRRLTPRHHRFKYSVFALLLDLDELPALDRDLHLFTCNRRGLFSFRDSDHGPANGEEPRGLYQKLVAEIERPLIEQAMRRADGNQVRAARILGLNRNTLRKKLVDLGIATRKLPLD